MAGTLAPCAVSSVKALAVMVEARIASLKVAVTALPTCTPAAPGLGVRFVTVGGVTSTVTLRSMSPWISVAFSARL